ncbi:MAG: hypothetical protein V3W44_09840 [Dehalococcoidales bacterium]
MFFKPHHNRSEAIEYAIEQARDGAIAVQMTAYVHDVGQNKFHVNAQPTYNGREPMCHVLPNLDVIWNTNEKGEMI